MCVGWGELSLCGCRVCSMVCVLPFRSGHFLIESFYTFSSKRWTPCCSFMFKTFMVVCLYIRGARMKIFVLTLNGLQDTGR